MGCCFGCFRTEDANDSLRANEVVNQNDIHSTGGLSNKNDQETTVQDTWTPIKSEPRIGTVV